MSHDEEIQVHSCEMLEQTLSIEAREQTTPDGSAMSSPSGFAVFSPSGFAVFSPTGFAIL